MSNYTDSRLLHFLWTIDRSKATDPKIIAINAQQRASIVTEAARRGLSL